MKQYVLILSVFIHCTSYAGFNSKIFAVALLSDDTTTINQQLNALSNSGNRALERTIKVGIKHGKFTPDDQLTPLMIAAYKGNTKILKELIDRNVTIDQQNNYGRTASMFAALGQQYRCFKLLEKNNANLTIIDSNDHDISWYWSFTPRPFISAVLKDDRESIERYMPKLEEAKDKANEQVTVKKLNRRYKNKKNETFTPLMAIAAKQFESEEEKETRQYYAQIIVKFAAMGVPFNTQNNYGRTALMYAARSGDGFMIQVFRDNGADHTLTDQSNKTFFDHAQKLKANIESTAVVTTPKGTRRHSRPLDEHYY